MALVATALFLTSLITPAAVSIDGIADESIRSGSVTFTVPEEIGFTIVPDLDGVLIPVATPHSESRPGYHELHVTKTPDGGGVAESVTVQFIVQDPSRGGSDDGMPTWTPYPPVDAPAAALDGTDLAFITPSAVSPGQQVPIVLRLTESDGAISRLNATALLTDADGNTVTIKLRRGAGAGSWTAPALGPLTLTARLGSRAVTRHIATTGVAPTLLAGTLTASQTFPAHTVVDVPADTTVPAGMTLRFESGCIVRLAAGVTVEVLGHLEIAGTTTDPVQCIPADPADPWGGFFLHGGASTATVHGAFLIGAGADSNWMDDNGFSSHRNEQAVFSFDADGGTCVATLTDCWIVDNPAGQAGHGEGAVITFTRCLIQRTRTCGQYNGGSFRLLESHAIEFPFESPNFVDADNDAMYLTDGDHHLRGSVIGWTKDDGIDCGGSATGTLLVEDCWIESCFHEGFALSGDKTVTISGTVATNNGQGLECGYDNPDATATDMLIAGNAHGARYGDSYDWNYSGTLRVTSSFLLENIADVFGHEWDSWTYREADMTIENNVVTTPLEHHPTNTVVDPAVHAAQVAGFIDQDATPRGFAVADRSAQNPRAEYGGSIVIHLDRPASTPVAIPWRILAKASLNAPGESSVASGILAFSTGATVASLDLPPLSGPTAAAAWIAIFFDNTTKALATGVAACHFLDLGDASANPVLVAFGSIWSYLADGSDQGATWRAPGFDDSSWSSGPGQLGYGGRSETTDVGYVDVDPATSGTQKNATTYFRHEFQVADPASITSLTLDLVFDDGAVVYLNGNRVAATPTMPVGDPDHDFYTGSTTTNNDTATFMVDASGLVAGSNSLAVEIHQAGSGSSDISFDLALTATHVPGNSIDATSADIGNRRHMFWTTPGTVPQSSPDLADWLPRPDLSSPIAIPPTEPASPRGFFRLSLP